MGSPPGGWSAVNDAARGPLYTRRADTARGRQATFRAFSRHCHPGPGPIPSVWAPTALGLGAWRLGGDLSGGVPQGGPWRGYTVVVPVFSRLSPSQ